MNDGDKGLVVQNDLFIKVAERNMQGVLPLFYEMSSASAGQITSEKIYESLLLAFKANIGEVSNNITKVFNSNNIDLNVVKWLTAENNYIIDYAKSLYMPTRPDWADEIIKSYIKSKVPHFFIEAKDKEKHQVEPLNCSTVNRLRKIIPNKAIKFNEIAGEFDYHNLMSSEIKNLDQEIIKEYRRLELSKRWIIRNEQHRSKKEGKFYVDKYIREKLKEINHDEERIVNVLVEYLYGKTKSKNKSTLWDCYGDILLRNLKSNIKGTKQCESCGERIEEVNNKKKYCQDCAKEINKQKTLDSYYRKKKFLK